jgi:penicillin-binding protein 1A
MHPRLVAGAWVGFNDPRVTLRSDYWGQGAHNALPMVAEFFRQAMNTKVVDVRAEFPGYGTTFVGGIMDRLEEWLGWKKAPGSDAPRGREGKGGDGVFGRAREAFRDFERWHQELEKNAPRER